MDEYEDGTIRSHLDAMGGDDCVGNTRIPVWVLVSMRYQGDTDDTILSAYPALSAADLGAAWRHFGRDPRRIVAQRARHFKTPALLTDATVSSDITNGLSALGLDVQWLPEVMSEIAVLRHATVLGRALVTGYGSVFKRLHREFGGQHSGVVLVPADAPPTFIAKAVAKAAFEERIVAGRVLKIERPTP